MMTGTAAMARRGDIWVTGALFALPVFMIAFDLATGFPANRRMWFTPAPVLLFQIAVFGYAWASGALRESGLRAALMAGPGRWMVRLALAVMAYAVLRSALVAPEPFYSAIKLADLGLAALFAWAVAALVLRSGPGGARSAMQALAFGVAVAVPVQMTLYLTGISVDPLPLSVIGFSHIRIYGFATTLALVAAMALWVTTDAGRERLLIAGAMVLLWAALWWSGSRAGPVALVAGLIVTGSVAPVLLRALLPALGTLVVGAALSTRLPVPSVSNGMFARFSSGAEIGVAADVSSGRLDLWRVALEELAPHQWTGTGIAQSYWLLTDSAFPVPHVQTHNLFVDAVLAVGWIGAVLLAGLATWAWARWAARTWRTGDGVQAGAFLLVTVFLVYALLDGIYFYHQGLIPFAVAAGLLMAAGARKPS